jgi:hypothetical protein
LYEISVCRATSVVVRITSVGGSKLTDVVLASSREGTAQ